MINPTREQVAVALFTKLQTLLYNADTNPSGPFKLMSRRPQLWDEATSKPALYQGETLEQVAYSGDLSATPLHVMYFPITLYIKSGLDPTTTPDTTLNNLLDALDTALAPPPYDPNTPNLGGIVAYARIEGEIMRMPGYLDGQGKVLLTIKVLVPG